MISRPRKPFCGIHDNIKDQWTTECLIDELALHLAQVTEHIAKENGEKITVRKYYHQAKSLMRLIPIARPPPVFIISNSDLTPRLRIEIESIRDSPITLRYVLTQSIGRIFENLDFRYYHLSLARNLRVKLSL